MSEHKNIPDQYWQRPTQAHEAESAILSPEALATQQLTLQAERILATSPDVSQIQQEDGSVTERVGLTNSYSYENSYSGKTETKLSPTVLEKITSPEGVVTYRHIDLGTEIGPVTWGSDPASEAGQELFGIRAQRAGESYVTLTGRHLEEKVDRMSTAGTYNTDTQRIIRGHNTDRIVKKNVLGALARIGMTIYKRFQGDMDAMTHYKLDHL